MADKPKIRFKGFTDAWEQRKVSDLITDIADGPFGSNLKTEHYTDEKEARIIQLSNLSDYGWQEENTRYTTFEHAKEIKRCIVNEGELVMGKMMPAGMTIMRPNTEKMYVLSSDCVRIKLDNGLIENQFFLYTTKSEPFLTQVNNDSQGSTRVRTSISKIRNMDFSVPSLPEQAKIGDYFSNLDNLITLHQRKCDELKKVKKFMLQNLFPKNGEKYPAIRFEGFTDAWEQRKFSELYERSSEKNDGSVGIEKNITVATMQFKPDVKVTTEEYLRTYYTFNLGDIAFEGHQSKEFKFGRFVENDIGNGIVSHIFAVFRPIVNYDLNFWKYLINNEGIMQGILSRSTKASTMMHDLVTNDFLKEEIIVPSIEEQIRIGECFKYIDNLLTLHQRKCDEIKEVKKFMLQNMFV